MNLRMEDQLHHAETIAEILEFSVADAYRSRGVGKDMFAIGCQIAKDWGCTQMEAASNQLRTDAHRLDVYKRQVHGRKEHEQHG